MQDPKDQQIQELTNRLVNSQSRSFEMIDGITRERDEARTGITRLDNILKAATQALSLEAPTVDELLAEITRLVAAEKLVKGKKPKVVKDSKA